MDHNDREQFWKTLCSLPGNDIVAEREQLFKSIKYPKLLFRYRPVSTKSLEALRTNKLYFSSANYYDDPFDTFLHIDISFRISLYIANFLGENEAQAQQIFKQVRKIYSSRSSAVHGNKTKDNLESAVEESANLLTRILRRCAELNKLPDVDNLAFRVDKQKQGIKCKILVP